MATQSIVILLSNSVAIRDAVEHVFSGGNYSVRFESRTDSVLRTVQPDSVVICTLEVDWRRLVASLRASDEPPVPVILLLPVSDARLWADAFLAGAFDVVIMTDGPECLLRAVERAQRRYARATSVRAVHRADYHYRTA